MPNESKKQIEKIDSFICPECNSTEYKSHLYVSTIPDPNDPWSNVLQQYECAKCENYIPAHLAERWENMTVKQAKDEWINVYKKNKI